jgi:hypothetical protein
MGVNPNSAAQVLVRNILKVASQGWRLLSAAQRSAWEAAAALIPRLDSLGRTYFQTGQQFFVGTEQGVKQYSPTGTRVTDPSTVVTPTDLTSMTITCTAA